MPFIFRRIRPSGKQVPLIAALLIVYIVWGTTYLAISVALETVPVLLVAGLRWMSAGPMPSVFAARNMLGTQTRFPSYNMPFAVICRTNMPPLPRASMNRASAF